ncbi:MAG: alpha/beta hydrolase, partial [Sciscionella sp.]
EAIPPRLHWTGCGGRFQCATAEVPLDYHHPNGKKIDIAVTRLPAADRAKRLGPLFVNYGGPGTPAVGELQEHAFRFPALLRQRFDLVAFDPRGVGASTPVRCGADESRPASLGSPLRSSQRDRFFASASLLGRECAKSSGSLLSHLSTANTARDMELLRRAMGHAPLSFLGYSYGTYLGGTYANLFPEETRTMVFDGTLDLVANARGKPGEEREPVDVRADTAGSQAEELARFLKLCKEAGPKCAFSSGDPTAKFAKLFASFRTGGALPGLIETVSRDLESASRWSGLGESLQGLYGSGVSSAPKTRTLDPYVPPHAPAFLATQCVDSDNPSDPRDYVSLAESEDRRTPYFGPSAVFNMAGCIDWPAHDRDRYLGPWDRERSNPILVVNNRYDPATPLANAKATADELGNAGLLTVEGYGHTTLNVPSTCASRLAARYLVSAELPAQRSCQPDTRPFQD